MFINLKLFFKAIGFIFVFIFNLKKAFANQIEFDKGAHGVIGFQSAILVERFLQNSKYSTSNSVIIANSSVLLASLFKEKFIDPVYSYEDVQASMFGSISGTLLFLILPKKTYTLETEGGLHHYQSTIREDELNNLSPTDQLNRPPSNKFDLIKAQSTLWFNGAIGFHQFSGGSDNGAADDSGKKLFYGAGLRMTLIPFLNYEPKISDDTPHFSSWFGVDYGMMLLATETQNVTFLKSKETIFYSLGIRTQFFHLFTLAGEINLIPYGDGQLWGSGLSLTIPL